MTYDETCIPKSVKQGDKDMMLQCLEILFFSTKSDSKKIIKTNIY